MVSMLCVSDFGPTFTDERGPSGSSHHIEASARVSRQRLGCVKCNHEGQTTAVGPAVAGAGRARNVLRDLQPSVWKQPVGVEPAGESPARCAVRTEQQRKGAGNGGHAGGCCGCGWSGRGTRYGLGGCCSRGLGGQPDDLTSVWKKEKRGINE